MAHANRLPLLVRPRRRGMAARMLAQALLLAAALAVALAADEQAAPAGVSGKWKTKRAALDAEDGGDSDLPPAPGRSGKWRAKRAAALPGSGMKQPNFVVILTGAALDKGGHVHFVWGHALTSISPHAAHAEHLRVFKPLGPCAPQRRVIRPASWPAAYWPRLVP